MPSVLCSRALQEAQEIFGIDFNFDDFGEYSDELDEEDDVSAYFCIHVYASSTPHLHAACPLIICTDTLHWTLSMSTRSGMNCLDGLHCHKHGIRHDYS